MREVYHRTQGRGVTFHARDQRELLMSKLLLRDTTASMTKSTEMLLCLYMSFRNSMQES